MSTNEFEALIETAWNDHAAEPAAVAARLQASLAFITQAAHIAPFARITTHVFGEHLGQWQHGVALLQKLFTLSVWDEATHRGLLERNLATLRYCESADATAESSALQTLNHDDQIAALATAAACLVGVGQTARAMTTFNTAIERADSGLSKDSPALRALAVAGNNMAASLEELPQRDATQNIMMLKAANAGVRFWKLAGTWLETERAYYRLANSLMAAGQPDEAIRAAERCIAVCDENAAPAFEKFFGHAMKAIAARSAGERGVFETARSAALAHFELVPNDERSWCKRELEALNAS